MGYGSWPLVIILLLSLDEGESRCRLLAGNESLACDDVYGLSDLCSSLVPGVRSLTVRTSRLHHLDWSCFQNGTELRIMELPSARLSSLNEPEDRLPFELHTLDLRDNLLRNMSRLSYVAAAAPELRTLRASGNRLGGLEDCPPFAGNSLTLIDLSRNRLRGPWCSPLSPSLDHLNLSSNQLTLFNTQLPKNLMTLDMKSNQLNSFPSIDLRLLGFLDLSDNGLTSFPSLKCPRLTELLLGNNQIEHLSPQAFRFLPSLRRLDLSRSRLLWLDMGRLRSSLTSLSLAESPRLESLQGSFKALPRLTAVNASVTGLRGFRSGSLVAGSLSLDLGGAPLDCCHLDWLRTLSGVTLERREKLKCQWPPASRGMAFPFNASFEGASESQCLGLREVWARYYANATLPCRVAEGGQPIAWYRILGGERHLIQATTVGDLPSQPFQFESPRGNVSALILPSGSLLLIGITKATTGAYVCEVEVSEGVQNATVHLLLDHSYWSVHVYIYSLFCGVATALGFFSLHVTWAGIRSIILWRIRQMENTSRLKKMLEALEKYRQRQLEVLYEEYNSRMTQIRDNYHYRSDQLRTSYISQTERFSNYKAQQMETMQASIDTMRENYTAQMGRVRDYGGRQTERLWESYQRQVIEFCLGS